MSRAAGKYGPRRVLAETLGTEPTEGERREMGIGETRDIPGGLNHLEQDEVRRQEVGSKPAELRTRKDLAHGVPPDEAGHYDRDGQHARPAGGQSGAAKLQPGEDIGLPSAVPVYIVEKAGGRKAKPLAAFRRITLPKAGSEPVTISPASDTRVFVQVLNEDQTVNCRVGNLEDLSYDYANSAFSGGSRLPAAATGYTVFRTKDQVFGVSESASAAVVISVILEDELAGGL